MVMQRALRLGSLVVLMRLKQGLSLRLPRMMEQSQREQRSLCCRMQNYQQALGLSLQLLRKVHRRLMERE